MKKKIIHLYTFREYMGATISGTLCGKQQWQGGEAKEGGGINITQDEKEVTCKLCLKQMNKLRNNEGDGK